MPSDSRFLFQSVAPEVSAEIVAGTDHDLTVVQAGLVNERIVEFVKQEPAGPKTSGSAAADGSTIRPVISFTATGRSIC
jgi:hypothetical protein